MKIKLSIKNQALTPRQKGAIVEKLEEIKAIIKEKSRAEEIDEYFSKLRYENEKYKENWFEERTQNINYPNNKFIVRGLQEFDN